jgi:hypothetical protein
MKTSNNLYFPPYIIWVKESGRVILAGHVERVRFEVFTAVTMKNVVFWDVTPCGSCKKRRFGGT